jgi:hypothetical protein
VRWTLSSARITHRWSTSATADVPHRRSRATTTSASTSTTATTSASSTAAPTSASGIEDARRCDQKTGGHGEYHKGILA